MRDPAFSPRATADLTDVHVSYGDRAALAGVDVAITSGAVTVITGPNGAGKSTLLEVLGGTRAMTSGSRTVRGAVAFVPQRAAIPDGLPVSVRDVVSVGAWGRLGLWRRMDAAAHELVETSMDRLEILSLAREPFSALSGGQQQRALLAQGLARKADLLMLDEPTTGLDASSARRIRAVLREEATRGVAVVCVSHDPAVIGDADCTIPLLDGRVRVGA